MIRAVIANQRGGSAKTTTTAVLARSFADRGLRVLMIDADPQGSLAVILGLTPPAFLNDLLIEKLAFRECVVSVQPGFQLPTTPHWVAGERAVVCEVVDSL
jgi:chromosome partitioning protein